MTGAAPESREWRHCDGQNLYAYYPAFLLLAIAPRQSTAFPVKLAVRFLLVSRIFRHWPEKSRWSDSRKKPSKEQVPMTIAQREQQIHRVKASSFQPELDEVLEQALRSAVIAAVKITLEAALGLPRGKIVKPKSG